jgi:hypothetical protein
MPIDISTEATTRSMIRNGRNSKPQVADPELRLALLKEVACGSGA